MNACSKDITYLKEITLKDNYAWVNENLKVDNLNKAKIRYIGGDKDNYVQTEFDVILIHEKSTEIDDASLLDQEKNNNKFNGILISLTLSIAVILIIVIICLKSKKHINYK